METDGVSQTWSVFQKGKQVVEMMEQLLSDKQKGQSKIWLETSTETAASSEQKDAEMSELRKVTRNR